MKSRTVAMIAVIAIIIDLILLTVTIYYYQIERWATGTIYLAIGFSGTFFTIVGVSERSEPQYFNEELKIMESDKKYLGGNDERRDKPSNSVSC